MSDTDRLPAQPIDHSKLDVEPKIWRRLVITAMVRSPIPPKMLEDGVELFAHTEQGVFRIPIQQAKVLDV